MIRTQIQLTEEQSLRLRQAARRSGVSTAEVIRRSVDRYLEQDAAVAPGGTRLAMLEVIGKWSCGLSDISDRHDDYLDEAYLPRRDPGAGHRSGRPGTWLMNAGGGVYLDTSGLFSLFHTDDVRHSLGAQAWHDLIDSDTPLHTSNYVLVELSALLQRRLGLGAVDALGTHVLPWVNVLWVDEALHAQAVAGASRRSAARPLAGRLRRLRGHAPPRPAPGVHVRPPLRRAGVRNTALAPGALIPPASLD